MSDEIHDLYVLFDERLRELAATHIESHLRVRGDMEKGFTEIRGQFNDVFAQARVVSDRTLIIETERSMERRAAVKVGAIYGAIAGAITSTLIGALMR